MMPAVALIGLPGRRWLPPVPIPLFLLWPLVLVFWGVGGVLSGVFPTRAAQLCTAMRAFGELHGLVVDVETRDHKKVRIRFI